MESKVDELENRIEDLMQKHRSLERENAYYRRRIERVSREREL